MTNDTKQYKTNQGQQGVPARVEDPEDLQFEVSESHDSSAEFVGGKKGFTGNSGEELGVESPADILQNQSGSAHRESVSPDDRIEVTQDFGGKIEGFASNAEDVHTPNSQKPQAIAPPPTASPARPADPSRIRQLSEKELKQIEQNLYGSSPKLSDRERGELLSKLSTLNNGAATGPASQSSSKIASPKTAAQSSISSSSHDDSLDSSQPTVARRARGTAYFYKNWVQIVTSHPLHADDEIVMGDRSYILRPKQLSGTTKMTLYGVLAGLAIIFIAIAMVGGNGAGAGSIVGVVLNTEGQPYIQGAVIQITDAGLRTESNGIGMFRLDNVPKGSHKLDFLVAGKVIGSDFATATDNDLTMTVLRMAPLAVPQQIAENPGSTGSNPSKESSITAGNTRNNASTATNQTPARRDETTSRSTTSMSSAKLVLEANVSDARMILDGKTLGAGNNTYSSLRPGDHKYQVSRDGFKPASGMVNLSAGESKTLSVQLEPDRVAGKPATSETQYFESAGIKMQTGDYSGAIADYTKAVEAKPSYADAFVMRAEAYRSLSDPKSAHDDFIRAAEIYRFRRDPSNAQTSFAKAIEVDGRSVTAYLGRADLFLSQGQEIAALADYEQVLRLDKRSFEAHFGLGRCRFNQGNYKQAERHFKDARDIDRQKTATYEYLMLCYFQLDQLKDLKKTWEQFRGIAEPADVTRMKSDSRFAAAIRTAESQ